MANTSLSSLRSAVRTEMLGTDPNGKVWADANVNAAIGDAFRHIQRDFNYDLDACKGSFSLTTVPGQQEYPVLTSAPDFVQLRDVIDATGQLLQPDDKENLYALGYFNNAQSVSHPSRRYFFGGNLGLYPVPNAVQTLLCFYRKALAIPASDAALSPLPVDFDRAVSVLSAYYLWSQPRGGSKESADKMERQYLRDELPSLKTLYALQDRRTASWGVKRMKYSQSNQRTGY